MEMMGDRDVDGSGKMEEHRSRCGSVQVKNRKRAERGSLAQKK
jgi:hypothetical protein